MNITQTDGAFRLGLVAPANLSHYLLGRREIPISFIKKFSKEFNIPFAVLMGEEDYNALNFTDPDFLIIIDVIDKFLADQKLYMSAEAKAKLMSHFYKQKVKDSAIIKGALSGMLATGSEIFIKSK